MNLTEKQLKELQDAITSALWEKITNEVKKQIEEITEKKLWENSDFNSALEDIKTEVKNLKNNIEEKKVKNIDEKIAKEAIVKIFKKVANEVKVNEEKIENIKKDVFSSILWTASNATETSLWKLVFEQFHKDISYFIKEDNFIKECDLINIIKWDSYSFIDAVNWITTEYVEQAEKGSPSTPTFKTVKVEVHKIYSQVNITEEQYDQMTSTDIYALIVKMIWESQTNFIRNELLNWKTKVTWIFNLAWANILTVDWSLANVTDDLIIDIQGSIDAKYTKKAKPVHIMNKFVFTQLRKLKTLKWERIYPDLRGNEPTIDWDKVILVDEAWEVTNSSTNVAWKKAWAYWVLKNMKIVKRQDLTLEKGYVNDWMLRGIETTVAKQRFWAKFLDEKAMTIIKIS